MRRLLTSVALVTALTPALIAGAAASPAAAPTWLNTGPFASSPTSVAVDPSNAQNVFASGEQRIAVSRDGGRTWGTALDLRRERADVGPLLAVPGTPTVLYAAKQASAASKPRAFLLASHDAGRSWLEVGELPRSVEAWAAALVGDPTDASTFYLVSRGIFRSVDAGRTWTRIYSAAGRPPVRALAVDPFDPKVLYALVRGGLRRSENGGRTWQRVPMWPAPRFALDPHRRGTVYAVGDVFFAVSVYMSKDRGRTWSPLGTPLDPKRVLDLDATLLVYPVRPGVVYAGTSYGVYVKRPGTATWQPVGPAGRWVRVLAADAKGRRLYAGIEGGGVAATRLPLPATGVRSSTSSHSSAKPGASRLWGIAGWRDDAKERSPARQPREES